MNRVMILNIYKELLDKLDLCAVAKEFVGSNEQTERVWEVHLVCIRKLVN